MTLSSDDQGPNGSFRSAIRTLNRFLLVLKEFESNYNKRLNISNLTRFLKIKASDVDDLISLILEFQEQFNTIFNNYRLKKKSVNNHAYLIVEKLDNEHHKIDIPPVVKLSLSQLKLFNDIIYIFKFMKRGKGFDVSKNGTELIANLKTLKDAHPYLFDTRGNGIIYPSRLGIKLGELIMSYNKSNKKIDEFIIGNHVFSVMDDG
ncbi:MAG: hypothetical protein HWN66_17790 [Candidatus Helarchaeota archaeon]|nr:hypothetical protein [Candidatus Helarchaeota archaeon]